MVVVVMAVMDYKKVEMVAVVAMGGAMVQRAAKVVMAATHWGKAVMVGAVVMVVPAGKEVLEGVAAAEPRVVMGGVAEMADDI